MPASSLDSSKASKLERYNSAKIMAASSKLLFRATILTALLLILLFTLNYPPVSQTPAARSSHRSLLSSAIYGDSNKNSGAAWEEVGNSATPRRRGGMSVLVTGAAGFVGMHCSLALKKRGDGVVGLDNFNSYYDPSLKRARQSMLARREGEREGTASEGGGGGEAFSTSNLSS